MTKGGSLWHLYLQLSPKSTRCRNTYSDPDQTVHGSIRWINPGVKHVKGWTTETSERGPSCRYFLDFRNICNLMHSRDDQYSNQNLLYDHMDFPSNCRYFLGAVVYWEDQDTRTCIIDHTRERVLAICVYIIKTPICLNYKPSSLEDSSLNETFSPERQVFRSLGT